MTSAAARPHANPANLAIIAILGLCGLAIYWWVTFSGPFLWLIDLQNLLFGSYREWPAVVVLGIATMVAAGLADRIAKAIAPRLSPGRGEALVLLLLLIELGGLLFLAWGMWQAGQRTPRITDPLQVIDLDRIGDGPLPAGHVRLIARADHARQVFTTSTDRRYRTLWALHEPLVGRHRTSGTPVRLVGDSSFWQSREGARRLPLDPEGLLIADGYDRRTVYRVRRAGLPLADHAAVLFWPTGREPMDYYVTAVMLAFPVALFLILHPFTLIRERRLRAARSRGE